jgi:hypothetical protein
LFEEEAGTGRKREDSPPNIMVDCLGALLEGTYYREKLERLESQVRRRSNYLTRGENRERSQYWRMSELRSVEAGKDGLVKDSFSLAVMDRF